MFKLTTLGHLSVSRAGEELERLAAHKQKMALLVYLAVEGPTARDILLALFWGEKEQEKARHSLSQALYQMRRELGEGCLRLTGDRIGLESANIRVDVTDFEAASAQRRWSDAVTLYRGPFMPGFYLDAPGFESWLESQRERLNRLQREAHEELLNETWKRGDVEEALAVALRWVRRDPLSDEAQHRLIELLAAAGNRSEALEQYERYAIRLKQELDLEPLEETQSLMERIRAGELTAGVGLLREPVRTRPSKVSEAGAGVSAVGQGPAGPTTPSILAELSQRRVFQLVVLYAGVAWISLEATGLFIEQLGLPRWIFPMVFFLLAAGLPVTMVLARTLAKEIQPLSPTQAEAIAAEGALGAAARPPPSLIRRAVRFRYVLAALVLMAIALFAARELVLRDEAVELGAARVRVLALPFQVSGAAQTEWTDLHAFLKYELERFDLGEGGVLDASRLPGPPAQDLEGAFSQARRHGVDFVVASSLLVFRDRAVLIASLYDVATKNLIEQSTQEGQPEEVLGLIDGAVLDLYPVISADERLAITRADAVERVTHSLPAWSALESGVAHFRRAGFKAAADDFERAIEADTGLALGYFHLSLAHYWLVDPRAARAAILESLARRDRLGPRGLLLAQAHQAYLQGIVDSSIAFYEQATERYPDDTEAWLGLAESYYHLGPYAGYSPADVQSTFERLVEVDTAFSPAYYHLADLAHLTDNPSAMRRYLDRFLELSADEPEDFRREWLPALWQIVYGSPAERARALENPPRRFWEVIQELVRGGKRLALADSVAQAAAVSGRPPRERQNAHQYRFVALAVLGQWDRAVEQWRAAVEAGADSTINPWVVTSYLAGYPADSLALPMLEAAAERLADPSWPDTALTDVEDPALKQFRALVQYAAVKGDSSLVQDLQARLARSVSDRYDALTPSLHAALDARLAMLASDTTAAIAALRRCLNRFAEPLSAFLPTTVLAAQRLLLSQLFMARGDYDGALRWLDSFEWSFAIADVLFLEQARELRRAIARARSETGR